MCSDSRRRRRRFQPQQQQSMRVSYDGRRERGSGERTNDGWMHETCSRGN